MSNNIGLNRTLKYNLFHFKKSAFLKHSLTGKISDFLWMFDCPPLFFFNENLNILMFSIKTRSVAFIQEIIPQKDMPKKERKMFSAFSNEQMQESLLQLTHSIVGSCIFLVTSRRARGKKIKTHSCNFCHSSYFKLTAPLKLCLLG